MNDEQKKIIIDMIENRILSEHRKHSSSLPNDWAKIAAHKIVATLLEMKIENIFTETK